MANKRPYFAVLTIQVIYAGMYLISKAAFNVGMNNLIFVFYRQAFATVFLVPIALYFVEWRSAPPISFKTLCKIFLASLCGVTASLDLYGVALVNTTASLGAATTNSLPVSTFFLAVLFRCETWKLKTAPGLAKLAAMVICLGGSLVLAFYEGHRLEFLSHQPLLRNAASNQHDDAQGTSSRMRWIKGCFLMLTSNTCWSLWLIMQARLIKCYPSKLLFTTLSCFMSAIQSFVIAICVERDPAKWMLAWNIRLLATVYCGIIVTGCSFYLQAFVIQQKGPVFLSMWTPMLFVITSCFSVLLLGEAITLGSVLGGLLLAGGLYCVLWAKRKEEKLILQSCALIQVHDQNHGGGTKEDMEIKNDSFPKTSSQCSILQVNVQAK